MVESDIQMMDDDDQIEGAAYNHRIQISNLDSSEPAAAKHAQNDYGDEEDEMMVNEMTIGTKHVLIDLSSGEQF